VRKPQVMARPLS